MNDLLLTCNANNCNNKLVERAYITSCSHIFCRSHGDTLVKGGKVCGSCLVCNTRLDKQYDCLLMDLNPSDQYKSMVLNGLNPEQIMDIAGRAISFFMYQINFDRQMKENFIKNLQHQQEEVLISMSTSYKSELSKKQRFTDTLKKELEEKAKELEIQKQKLYNIIRENKNLRAKIENNRRGQVFERQNMEHKGSSSTFSPVRFTDLHFVEDNEGTSHYKSNRVFNI